MTKKQYLGLAVIVLLVSALGSYIGKSVNLGAAGYGANFYDAPNFLQGLYAGTTGQFSLSNSGVLSDSGAATFSGGATLSGTNTLSGATTISGAKTFSSGASTFTSTSTFASSTVISGTATLSGAKTLSGSTSTLSASNLLSNSTSTGIVLRATDGSCYLIQLGTGGAFGTSTAGCQ